MMKEHSLIYLSILCTLSSIILAIISLNEEAILMLGMALFLMFLGKRISRREN